MPANSPWSVKGVDPETREAAKIAARRAGMTVGQWLSHTIRTAAAAQLSGASRPEPAAAPPRHNGSDDRAAAPPTGAARPPAPTLEVLLDNIQKLASRLDRAEMRTAATLGPLSDQVERLARRVDDTRSEAAVSTAPVERAVTRLAERLERIETREAAPRAERRWRLFGG